MGHVCCCTWNGIQWSLVVFNGLLKPNHGMWKDPPTLLKGTKSTFPCRCPFSSLSASSQTDILLKRRRNKKNIYLQDNRKWPPNVTATTFLPDRRWAEWPMILLAVCTVLESTTMFHRGAILYRPASHVPGAEAGRVFCPWIRAVNTFLSEKEYAINFFFWKIGKEK